MTLQHQKQRQQIPAIPERKIVGQSKKWQKMFRSPVEREKAIKELVTFVSLVHDLSEQSISSPDWIRNTNGGKIYL